MNEEEVEMKTIVVNVVLSTAFVSLKERDCGVSKCQILLISRDAMIWAIIKLDNGIYAYFLRNVGMWFRKSILFHRLYI